MGLLPDELVVPWKIRRFVFSPSSILQPPLLHSQKTFVLPACHHCQTCPSSFPLFFNLKLLHDFPFFSSIYCDRQLCRGAIWKYIFDIWSRLRLYCFPSTPIFGPTEKTEIMTILSLMRVIILILILEPTMMTFSQW